MAHVRFTQDFDYKPAPQVTIAYKAGMELTVKRECADQAFALGKAVEVKASRKLAKSPEDAEAIDAGRG